jgi:hypothetical protein
MLFKACCLGAGAVLTATGEPIWIGSAGWIGGAADWTFLLAGFVIGAVPLNGFC